MATVTSLGFSIFSTYNGRGVNAARRDLRGLDRTLRSVSKANNTLSDVPLNRIRRAATGARRSVGDLDRSVQHLLRTNRSVSSDRFHGLRVATTGARNAAERLVRSFRSVARSTRSISSDRFHALRSAANGVSNAMGGISRSVRNVNRTNRTVSSDRFHLLRAAAHGVSNAMGGIARGVRNVNRANRTVSSDRFHLLRSAANGVSNAMGRLGGGIRNVVRSSRAVNHDRFNALGAAARRAARSMFTLGDGFNSANRSAGGFGSRMRLIILAVLAAAPLVHGLSSAALKAGGALLTMGAQAAVAGGIYGAVMLAASKRAQTLADANGRLTRSQREHVRAVEALNNRWKRFLDTVGARTLQPMNIVIRAMTRNMGKLAVVVRAVHPEVMRVARAFSSWLDRSNGLKRFIGIIKNQGVQSLRHLLNAARHALGFLGIAFRTLAPDGVRMAAAIERGARALHRWGQSGGFARWVSSVRANGPAIKEFFRALGMATRQLLRALGGMAPVALQVATALLRIVAAMPVPVLQALIYAWISLRLALMAYNVAMAITVARTKVLAVATVAATVATRAWAIATAFLRGSLVATAVGLAAMRVATIAYTIATRAATVATRLLAIAFRLTPAGLIITALLAIAAAIVWLSTRTRFFQTVWRVAWAGIRAVAQASWIALRAIFRAIAAGWRGMAVVIRAVWRAVIRPVFGLFARVARFLWRGALRPVFNLIKAGWRLLGRVFRVVWRTVIRPVFLLFARIARFLWRNSLRIVFNLIKAGWRALGRVFRVVWRNVIRPIFTLFARVARFLWRNSLRVVFRLISAGWRALGRVFRVVWRAVIRPVFSLFGRAARFMWRNALRPVFHLIGAGWRALGRVIRIVWRTVISNAWGAMNAAARFMWRRVLRPTWNAIKGAWSLLGRLIRFVWRSGISNTWGAMNAAARFMWNRVLRPAWNAIKAAWRALGGAIRHVWRTGISNTWGALNAAARFMWNRVLRPTWNAIGDGWRALGRGITSVWRQGIRPAWEAMKKGLGLLRNSFNTAVGAIQKAWSKIKPIVAAPVRFFVNTVYNGGLRKAWNNTVGKIPGVTDLPSFTVNFARGGFVSGPGGPTQDKIPARLSAGEYVMRAKAVKKIGVGALNQMNRGGGCGGGGCGGCAKTRRPRRMANDRHRAMARRRVKSGNPLHMAVGGIIPDIDIGSIVSGASGAILKVAKTSDFLGSIGGFLGGIADAVLPGDPVSGAFDWATQFFQDIAKKGARALLNPFIGLTERISGGMFPGGGGSDGWNGVFPKLLKSAIDAMIEHIFSNASAGVMGNGFVPWKPWQEGDGKVVSWRGHQFNVRTVAMIKHAEKMLKSTFSIFQGSYSSGVAASGGTHSGGGAADLGPTGNKRVAALRASGFAAWNRGPGWGSSMFSKHIHAIAAGDPTVSGPGKAQLKQFFNGGDGLGGPDNFPGILTGMAGTGVQRWAALAKIALQMGGCAPTNNRIKEFLDLMRQESGGNPNAHNPSGATGLMQMKPATFSAFHCAGTSGNIRDPLANMCASTRYIKSRYGCSVPNAPYSGGGLVQALANGGMVPTFDQGGWLGPGLNVINNATGHNEPIGNQMRDEVNLHIHGSVYTKSDREFRDMIVKELANARRRGRA